MPWHIGGGRSVLLWAPTLWTGARSAPALPLLALVGLLAPMSASAAHPAWAIVVGHNAPHETSQQTLRYADDDAAHYARLLEQLGVNTILLTEFDDDSKRLHPVKPQDRATRKAIITAVATVNKAIEEARLAGHRTTLYFTYSGHGGVHHGEGYVALADGRFARSDFARTVLNESKADTKHVIVDSCKSYYFAYAKGEVIRIPYGGNFAVAASDRKDTGFLLSTSSARDSHEWSQYQGGVFSHQVRSGLYGAADVDLDGQITYDEMAGWVVNASRGVPNERYRPRMKAKSPETSDGILMDLSQAPRYLDLDEGLGDRFVLEDASGVRLVDIRPGRQGFRFALPANTKIYIRNLDKQLEYVLPPAGDCSLSRLGSRPVRSASRGALEDALANLFSEPFDARIFANLDLRPVFSMPTPAPQKQKQRQKPMPRVLLMVAEQTLGMHSPAGWWRRAQAPAPPPTASRADMRQAETVMIDTLKGSTWRFIDPQVAAGKLVLTPPISDSPSADHLRTVGTTVGADVVVFGKAVVTHEPMAKSRFLAATDGMVSATARLTARAVASVDGRIVATFSDFATHPGFSAAAATSKALDKICKRAAQALYDTTQRALSSIPDELADIDLRVESIANFGQLADLLKSIVDTIAGVESSELVSYDASAAHARLAYAGKVAQLASALTGLRVAEKVVSVVRMDRGSVSIALAPNPPQLGPMRNSSDRRPRAPATP